MPQNDNFHAFLNFSFFVMHEKLLRRRRKKRSYLPPFYSLIIHLTLPLLQLQKEKRGKKTFFGWKMKVKLFLLYLCILCFIFDVHWRVSCDDELNTQFLMYEKAERKRRRKKNFKEKQMKLIMDIGLLAWILFLVFRGKAKFPWICL